jgi:hypothetical protein
MYEASDTKSNARACCHAAQFRYTPRSVFLSYGSRQRRVFAEIEEALLWASRTVIGFISIRFASGFSDSLSSDKDWLPVIMFVKTAIANVQCVTAFSFIDFVSRTNGKPSGFAGGDEISRGCTVTDQQQRAWESTTEITSKFHQIQNEACVGITFLHLNSSEIPRSGFAPFEICAIAWKEGVCFQLSTNSIWCFYTFQISY